MKVVTVIPVGAGRKENLTLVMNYVMEQTIKPAMVVVVCDGPDAQMVPQQPNWTMPVLALSAPKHRPGMEQPRNLGVRAALQEAPKFDIELTHAWFLDSDCIADPSALAHYEAAAALAGPDSILVGPYDWLPPGQREPIQDYRNDPAGVPPPGRWASFDEHEPGEIVMEDLSAGLACFSGNLIWPIEQFIRVGGFWNELSAGRVEDGELGIRAVHMGVPISFVRGARAWHLDHPRNMEWIMETNAAEVPKLNQRHPWMEGRCTCGATAEEHSNENCAGFAPSEEDADICAHCGAEVEAHRFEACGCTGFKKAIFTVDKDGKRFNVRCPCGWEGNTALIWNHQQECPHRWRPA